MNDYCECCPNVIEHIRQHYDPNGLCRRGDDPGYTLGLFQDCFPGECDLSIGDVASYLETCPED